MKDDKPIGANIMDAFDDPTEKIDEVDLEESDDYEPDDFSSGSLGNDDR